MWRSLMFVPVLEDRLVQGAPGRGADLIVLDLEASVPVPRKVEARDRFAKVIPSLGCPAAVRVNLLGEGGDIDVQAARAAGASAIVVPMATVDAVAQAAALAGPDMPLIPLIEDPRGVINALAIGQAAPSVMGVGLGVEDYATQMGTIPSPDVLIPAGFQVIQAARAAGVAPFVLPDTIADFRDTERFETAARRGKAMGAAGGFAIHPAQVAVLNRCFAPTSDEIEKARQIVDLAEAARQDGKAVAQLDGQMIDPPVEARARAVLAQVQN